MNADVEYFDKYVAENYDKHLHTSIVLVARMRPRWGDARVVKMARSIMDATIVAVRADVEAGR